jgi:hypothetical protein
MYGKLINTEICNLLFYLNKYRQYVPLTAIVPHKSATACGAIVFEFPSPAHPKLVKFII